MSSQNYWADNLRIWLNFKNCTCTSYDGKDSTPYIEGWMIFDFEKNTVYVSDVSVDFYYPISEDNFNDAVYELSGAYPSNGAVNSPSAADNIASTDWKKEYLDFISTNDSDYSYMSADLDGNRIPELFAFEDGIGDIYWYAPGNGFGDTNLDCTVMSGYDPIYYVTKGSYSIIFALTYDGSRFAESLRCSPASASREIPSRMVCTPTMSGMMMSAGASLVRSRPL